MQLIMSNFFCLLKQAILIPKDTNVKQSFHARNLDVAENAMPNGWAPDWLNGVLAHSLHGKRTKELRQAIVERLATPVERENKE